MLRRALRATVIAGAVIAAMTSTAQAADARLNGSDGLIFDGDAAAETLVVTQTSATTVVFDLANLNVTTTTPGGCVASNTDSTPADTEVTCTVAGLTNVLVRMGAGNDDVTVSASVATFDVRAEDGDDRVDLRAATGSLINARGGEGVDTLIGGDNDSFLSGDGGNDIITGGGGTDLISGDLGTDTLNGGAGDDVLNGGSAASAPTMDALAVSDGSDTINGGDGSDTVSYEGRGIAVNVDLSSAGGDGQDGEGDSVSAVENIVGGNAGDILAGDTGFNTIDGGPGADTLSGGRGFDLLRGGLDADTINVAGDIEADLVDCGARATATPAGTDADVANLDYLDQVSGTADCETVNRRAAPARYPRVGSGLADRIVGDTAANLLLGLHGNDVLIGLAGPDELLGGSGNDVLNGGLGNDELSGGLGNDRLLGSDGADVLVGGPGRDSFVGGAGRDFLLSRNGDRGDVVYCTITRFRAQRDIVVADATDVIRNRAYCARVTIT